MAKLRKRACSQEDFQMAPMIDMVFLLLVFFMCVNTMAEGRWVELELPEAEQSRLPEGNDSRCVLSVGAEGELWLEGTRVSLEELRAGLARRIVAHESLQVQIRADAATRFEEIRRLLNVCAAEGVVDVWYSVTAER